MAVTTGWTVADLEVMPQPLDDTRYELIDGELYVSTQPTYQHQRVCSNTLFVLEEWSERTGKGQPVFAPGVVFARHEAVAPDVVWTSTERLPFIVGEDGTFHAAPDLIGEVLAPGAENEQRDRETKLRLYSRRGVQEYWLIGWRPRAIEVYRRQDAALQLVATLFESDTLTSPLLPGFSYPVARFFAGV